MAKAPQKIILSSSRDIPFDRLRLSQSNVRRVRAGVSIGELADDIVRRTLLQSLNVRPILNAAGQETGEFEVPAGGRRFRALELLVKQKRLAKNAPIPCVVRVADDGVLAEEDSYAENTFREPLLGHVSRLSFDRKNKRMVCLFQAARSAYPKSWRRAAWNKHLRGGCGIVPLAIGGDESVTRTPLGLSARLSAPHI